MAPTFLAPFTHILFAVFSTETTLLAREAYTKSIVFFGISKHVYVEELFLLPLCASVALVGRSGFGTILASQD